MRVMAREALAAALAARAGAGAAVGAVASQSWASATFAGARHRVEMRLPADAVAAFEEGLGEAAFILRGHLLADVAVIDRRAEGAETVLMVEALTIEES